jgi:hypothetical protein
MESFAPPCIHPACTVNAHFVRRTPKMAAVNASAKYLKKLKSTSRS